jgi:hypothetical protein
MGCVVDSAFNTNVNQKFPWGLKARRLARRADNLSYICEPIMKTTKSLESHKPMGNTTCYKDSFTF